MDKIETIQRSLRCFIFGLLALLPLIGIPMAVLAISDYYRVTTCTGDRWNVARPFLVWGYALGLVGLLISAAVVLFVVAAVGGAFS